MLWHHMWDYDGKRYTDMSSQLVNLNVGFGNRKIIDAIGSGGENMLRRPVLRERAERKARQNDSDLMPDNMGKVFFANAGADANENAIKIARMYTGRNKIFSRYRSYHGSTFGAGNLTGEPRRYPLEPGIPGIVVLRPVHLPREDQSSRVRKRRATTTSRSSASR